MAEKIILLVEDNPDVDFVQFADAVLQLGLYWLVLNESPPKSGRVR
jgi:hypothetical protein